MPIQLNFEQEKRVSEALNTGAYKSANDVIDRALDALREQDEWLSANRQAIDEKIRNGIEELDRGEGIYQGELSNYLAELKALPE